MSMKTGVALVGLLLALFGAFMPFVGLFVGWLALAIATIAALMGERGLTIATALLSAFAFVFLTPSLWIVAAGPDTAGGAERPVFMITLSIALVIAPIVAIVLNSSGKLVLSARQPKAS